MNAARFKRIFVHPTGYSREDILKAITKSLFSAQNQTLDEEELNRQVYNILDGQNARYTYTSNYEFEQSVNDLIDQGKVTKTLYGLTLTHKGIKEAEDFYNRSVFLKASEWSSKH